MIISDVTKNLMQTDKVKLITVVDGIEIFSGSIKDLEEKHKNLEIKEDFCYIEREWRFKVSLGEF